MSGVIQSFKEENKDVLDSKTENAPQTTNIAIKLSSYEDNKYFCGYRIDNNEYVKIFLREVEKKGKYERIGIERLSDEKDYKNFVEAGNSKSILLFESCYQEDNGDWNSRWVKVLSKPKKPAKVYSLTSSIKLVNYNNDKFFVVNAIKSIKEVKDLAILKNEVINGLKPKMKKMQPIVAVRFTDEIGDSIVYNFYPKKEIINEEKQIIQPEQYIDEYWGNEKFQKLLELTNKPQVRVEVILLTGMTFGADTNTKMLENQYEINRIKSEYTEENTNLPLYKNTILALREREDKTLFLISASPLENNKKGLKIENI